MQQCEHLAEVMRRYCVTHRHGVAFAPMSDVQQNLERWTVSLRRKVEAEDRSMRQVARRCGVHYDRFRRLLVSGYEPTLGEALLFERKLGVPLHGEDP